MNTSISRILSICARVSATLAIVAGLLAINPNPAYAATIVYVIPGGTGAGTSWADGVDLATALAGAASGSELWVKTGEYFPVVTEPAYPSRATFTLKNDVAVYGGFRGTEAYRTQRLLAAFPVTLNGQFTYNSTTYKSIHVVTAVGVTNTTVLDGFTIKNGDATTTDSEAAGPGVGGGLYLYNSSPILANLTVQNNDATNQGGGIYVYNNSISDPAPTLNTVTLSGNNANDGGGIAAYNSNLTLTNVTFDSNDALGGSGGGMLNYNSTPHITTATFNSNTAADLGAGMYNYSSSPTLTGASFNSNNAAHSGGGMANAAGSAPILTTVTFEGNHASTTGSTTVGMGGGMYNYNANPTLNQVNFYHNMAGLHGGGMYNASSNPGMTDVNFRFNTASGSGQTRGGGMYNDRSFPTLLRVKFYYNYCTVSGSVNDPAGESHCHGGGMFNLYSTPSLKNVLFTANRAYRGGAMYNYGSIPTLTQVTISGNTQLCNNNFCGGGMYNSADSDVIIRNSIIWGNVGSEVENNSTYGSCVPSYQNSIVQGSGGSGAAWVSSLGSDVGGNLDLDPNYVNPPTDTVEGDAHLNPGSPAINNGNSLFVSSVSTDLDGNTRLVGAAVDMGAYEYQGANLPPQTSITGSPATRSATDSPAFAFSSDEAGGTFQCKLDSSEWATCTSPQAYTAQSDGSHTFQVKATDTDGNVDWTPASFTWAIASASILTKPAFYSNSAGASFTFSAVSDLTFECSLDSGSFTPCTSPADYTSLTESSHTFQVRVVDLQNNKDATPTAYAWTVDLTRPAATINIFPANPAKSASASFTFSCSESGCLYQCALDGGTQSSCTSPVNFNSLADGSHTFTVEAIDPSGNVSASPASYTWTVVTSYNFFIPIVSKP